MRSPASILGYDVADGDLPGGLSNCGCSDGETQRLAPFAAALNEHHLFAHRAIAEAFAANCDERVREHAPFFVYEMRRRPR